MNRIVELIAMAIGGLSLFLVCFVGFAAMAGKDVSRVAVIGKLFPAPPEGEEGTPAPDEEHASEEPAHGQLSDAAVIESSLGVLSAWTLPSPYSTSELRVLSEEIKKKRLELEEQEHALGRRERAVKEDEQELEERLRMLEELRAHLEAMQAELADREQRVLGKESAEAARKNAGWAELAGVIGAIEDPGAAARKLQEFEPAEAAKILRALGDDTRAGEILNAVEGARWKDYVGAYTAEPPRAATRKP